MAEFMKKNEKLIIETLHKYNAIESENIISYNSINTDIILDDITFNICINKENSYIEEMVKDSLMYTTLYNPYRQKINKKNIFVHLPVVISKEEDYINKPYLLLYYNFNIDDYIDYYDSSLDKVFLIKKSDENTELQLIGSFNKHRWESDVDSNLIKSIYTSVLNYIRTCDYIKEFVKEIKEYYNC